MAGEWQAGMVAGYQGGVGGRRGGKTKKVKVIASVKSLQQVDQDDLILVEWNGKRKHVKASLLFRIEGNESVFNETAEARWRSSSFESPWLAEIIERSSERLSSLLKGKINSTGHASHSLFEIRLTWELSLHFRWTAVIAFAQNEHWIKIALVSTRYEESEKEKVAGSTFDQHHNSEKKAA